MGDRLTEIYAELEAIEADKAPAKASVILNGKQLFPVLLLVALCKYAPNFLEIRRRVLNSIILKFVCL